jgi:hypothetical protein
MNKNNDHIIMNGLTGCLECRHCHASEQVEMPMMLRYFVTVMNTFTAKHERCKP